MVERRNISSFITGLILKYSMFAKEPYDLKNSNEKKGMYSKDYSMFVLSYFCIFPCII